MSTAALTLVIVQGVVVALLAVLVAGLLRSHADILRRLHDLGAGDHTEEDPALDGTTTGGEPRGEPVSSSGFAVTEGVTAPRSDETEAFDVTGQVPGGGQRKVSVVGVDHPTLLAFLSSGCLTCAEYWERFDDPDSLDLPGVGTRLVIVTKGPEQESEAEVIEQAPDDIPTIMSTTAWNQYAVPGSPYFILVDGPSGDVLGEGSGTTWHQVQKLLHSALADSGLALDQSGGATARADGRAREGRADAELMAAGILPGDPRLYPSSAPQDEPPEASE